MTRSKRKRIVVVVCVFLLAFSTGVGVALLKGWVHFGPPSALYISKVSKNGQQPFTSHVSDLKTDESLDSIQFLNANVGWIGTHKGTALICMVFGCRASVLGGSLVRRGTCSSLGRRTLMTRVRTFETTPKDSQTIGALMIARSWL